MTKYFSLSAAFGKLGYSRHQPGSGALAAFGVGLVAAALLAAAGPAAAADGTDLPRVRNDLDPSDRKRVEQVVGPAGSFQTPERCERMQGGAGTSTKLVNRAAFRNSTPS